MQQKRNSYFSYGAQWAPEEIFYVREHRFYYTPSEWLVEWRLNNHGLNVRNADLAREMARFYYHQMVKDENYVEPSKVGTDEVKDNFYKELWPKKVPGVSPLDKAINALIIMKKSQSKNNAFNGEIKPGEVNITKAFEHLPDEEQFENTTYDQLFQQRAKIEDFEKKIDMLQRIGAVAEFGKSFEIKKVVTERRVSNSIMHKHKRMVEYGELINSPIYQKMLPHYNTKLITKDLIVNTPVIAEESKQKIIMLVDFSGSMNDRKKQDWILSIMADRLSYCIKEECEIFFSFFLTRANLLSGTFKFEHIYNEKTALEFFKKFNTSPSGGDTEVGYIVEEIRKEIMENKKLFNLNIDLSKEQPEILVINDGQDSVKTDKLTWKTNAITLYDGANSELKSLCTKTDGKYIFINHEFDKKYLG